MCTSIDINDLENNIITIKIHELWQYKGCFVPLYKNLISNCQYNELDEGLDEGLWKWYIFLKNTTYGLVFCEYDHIRCIYGRIHYINFGIEFDSESCMVDVHIPSPEIRIENLYNATLIELIDIYDEQTFDSTEFVKTSNSINEIKNLKILRELVK